MVNDVEEGKVVRACAESVEVTLASGEAVVVPFDNFAAMTPPALGEAVKIHLTGWSFGINPTPLWSLAAPQTREIATLGVRLSGFRRGRKRHLKFLRHQVGYARYCFMAPAQAPLDVHPNAAAAARLQATAQISGCPAVRYGEPACNGRPGVPDCTSAAFWSFEALIGRGGREYESAALESAGEVATLACLIVGPISGGNDDELQTKDRRASLLLSANPRHRLFIKAATCTVDSRRYSLLTSYIPDGKDPVHELLRCLEQAEHITRIHGGGSLRNPAEILKVKAAILATRRRQLLR